jgi:hypothetical protein
MSDEIDVYWRGDLAANGPTLRAALAALGFEATILHEFCEAHLFWPIEIAGLKTGFEVCASEFGKDFEAISKEMPKLNGRDQQATFRFFGDIEGGAAFAVAAALAKLGDALVRDRHAGIDIWPSSEEAAEKAHGMIERGIAVGRGEGTKKEHFC